jgi:hypothetical protein
VLNNSTDKVNKSAARKAKKKRHYFTVDGNGFAFVHLPLEHQETGTQITVKRFSLFVFFE